MKKPASRVGRRRFLKTVPATVAATVALPAVVPALLEAQRGGAAPPKFGTDALKCFEQIAGLSFSDAEEQAALGGVGRNLDSYEQLRKLSVPLDTEPAITFRPYSAAVKKRAPGGSARSVKISEARP